MRCQSLQCGHTAINHRPFGRNLKALLGTEQAYALLPEGTWMAGGCLLLAAALQDWAPGTLVWTVEDASAPGRPQHLVAVWGEYFIDGDGVATRTELLEKMRVAEGLRAPRIIPALDMAACAAADIQYDQTAKNKLVDMLRAKFGVFRHSLLSPAKPAVVSGARQDKFPV